MKSLYTEVSSGESTLAVSLELMLGVWEYKLTGKTGGQIVTHLGTWFNIVEEAIVVVTGLQPEYLWREVLLCERDISVDVKVDTFWGRSHLLADGWMITVDE